MKKHTKRFLLVTILLTIFILVLYVLRLFYIQFFVKKYTIQQLYDELPENQTVKTEGTVKTILKEYRSSSGNVYERFYLSEENKTILVFCLKDIDLKLKEGDRVRVFGKFQKFKSFYEIFGFCSDVFLL